MATKLGVVKHSSFSLFEVRKEPTVSCHAIPDSQSAVEMVRTWEHLKHKGLLSEIPRLQIQKRLFTDQTDDNDDAAMELEFAQAKHSVLSQELSCKPEEAISLGALCVMRDYGEFNHQQHYGGFLMNAGMLPEYASAKMCATLEPERIERLLLNVYERLPSMAPLQCAREYLNKVSSWPHYGLTLSTVKQSTRKDLPSQLLIGVHCKGLQLLEVKKKRLLRNFLFQNVVSWAASGRNFAFVDCTSGKHDKYVLQTRKGEEISQLIQAYIKCMMEREQEASQRLSKHNHDADIT